MSLFDIIKYSNIDLNDAYAIRTLPDDLIDLYWIRSLQNRPSYSTHRFDLSDHAWYLGHWSRHNPILQCQIFKETLKEYNNEPI